MVASTAVQERLDFAERLRACLTEAGYSADSPTVLMRQVNQRHNGGQPLSPHAVRKWLLGESIPRQDKLRVLADWFGVSTEWLRFSKESASDGPSDIPNKPDHLQNRDTVLLEHFRRLDHHNQEIVLQLVQALSKASRKIEKTRYRYGYTAG